MSQIDRINQVSGEIIDAAIKVHSVLGPGLLESAYQACLAYELRKRGLHVDVERALPIVYEDVRLEVGYRLDLLVEDLVVVEIKAVQEFHPIHEAQLLSYLRLADKKVGLILNFHERWMKDGIKRMVNGL